mgnify:CR=1 FL=1
MHELVQHGRLVIGQRMEHRPRRHADCILLAVITALPTTNTHARPDLAHERLEVGIGERGTGSPAAVNLAGKLSTWLVWNTV